MTEVSLHKVMQNNAQKARLITVSVSQTFASLLGA